MRFHHGAAILFTLLLPGCAGKPPAAPAPETSDRPFREFLNALENTLVEVNELERMGGGMRDRMILVDAHSLIHRRDELRYRNALRLNYGKIRSLRASLKGNTGIGEVLTRNGHSLDDLVAIDAKSAGAVILYFAP